MKLMLADELDNQRNQQALSLSNTLLKKEPHHLNAKARPCNCVRITIYYRAYICDLSRVSWLLQITKAIAMARLEQDFAPLLADIKAGIQHKPQRIDESCIRTWSLIWLHVAPATTAIAGCCCAARRAAPTTFCGSWRALVATCRSRIPEQCCRRPKETLTTRNWPASTSLRCCAADAHSTWSVTWLCNTCAEMATCLFMS